MDGIDQTKICPLCAETIKAAAKVCSHCRHWQKKWSLQNPYVGGTIGLLAWLALVPCMGLVIDHFIGSIGDFAPYRDQIAIVSSEASFRIAGSNLTVAVVGVVTNRSEFAWKNVGIEAQLFDKNEKLIDVIQANGEYTGISILPNGEAAFKIESKATKREQDYSSRKVFVRTAKNSRSWF